MKTVTVYSASWCSACGPVKGVLARIADEYGVKLELVNMDTADGLAAAKKKNIRGLPTLVCNGNRITGYKSETELRKWLREVAK